MGGDAISRAGIVNSTMMTSVVSGLLMMMSGLVATTPVSYEIDLRTRAVDRFEVVVHLDGLTTVAAHDATPQQLALRRAWMALKVAA